MKDRLNLVMSVRSRVLRLVYLQFNLKLFERTELGLRYKDERVYVTTAVVLCFTFVL